ncbi:MAG: hypothetical protein E5V24_15820, partial [Mesorhizobium sp.]
MGYKLIRYSVKDTGLEENRALVAKVFEALDETAPKSVRYLVLELDDGTVITESVAICRYFEELH